MKQILLSLLVMLSCSAFAQQVADADTLQEMIDYCKEVAAEEGTGDNSMNDFLLDCVNQELTSEDYQPVNTLPEY